MVPTPQVRSCGGCGQPPLGVALALHRGTPAGPTVAASLPQLLLGLFILDGHGHDSPGGSMQHGLGGSRGARPEERWLSGRVRGGPLAGWRLQGPAGMARRAQPSWHPTAGQSSRPQPAPAAGPIKEFGPWPKAPSPQGPILGRNEEALHSPAKNRDLSQRRVTAFTLQRGAGRGQAGRGPQAPYRQRGASAPRLRSPPPFNPGEPARSGVAPAGPPRPQGVGPRRRAAGSQGTRGGGAGGGGRGSPAPAPLPRLWGGGCTRDAAAAPALPKRRRCLHLAAPAGPAGTAPSRPPGCTRGPPAPAQPCPPAAAPPAGGASTPAEPAGPRRRPGSRPSGAHRQQAQAWPRSPLLGVKEEGKAPRGARSGGDR